MKNNLKKYAAILLCLLLAAQAAGCKRAEAEPSGQYGSGTGSPDTPAKGSAPEQTDFSAEGGDAPGAEPEGESGIPQKVPDIVINNGEVNLTMKNAIGSWSYLVKGGEWEGYCADGAHPIQWDYGETGAVMEYEGADFTVTFPIKPVTLEIVMWDAEYGGAEDGLEEILEKGTPVETAEEDGVYTFAVPGGREVIFSIYATWEDENYNGDGFYGLKIRAAGPNTHTKPMMREAAAPVKGSGSAGFLLR